MKYLRLFLCLVALTLTACMSHILLDTSTRLQIENKTDVAILGLDVVSEDGTSVRTWINETIEPGGKSKVVEEDWVGTFRVRVRFDKWNGETEKRFSLCAVLITDPDKKSEKVAPNFANLPESEVIEELGYDCEKNGRSKETSTYVKLTLDFEGGSQYLVVSQDENGKAVFKFK